MPFTSQEWIDRFVADLATVIGAIGEGAATAGAGDRSRRPMAGSSPCEPSRAAEASWSWSSTALATEALAKRVMGMDDEPSDDVVVDTLKELCAQAAGSMVLEPPLVGMQARHRLGRAVRPARAPESVLAQISVSEASRRLPLRLWGDIALVESPRESAPAAAPARRPRRRPRSRRASTPPETPKLDVILDIDLPLTVRFGRTEMPLRLIAALGPGSVIDLGRSPDDPVDVLVSNQLVARGEVVIVGGNYGVRITDVISPENGVRSLEDRV